MGFPDPPDLAWRTGPGPIIIGFLYGLASPDVLLSPLTTQEAVLSSKIEGLQATLCEVLKFEAGEAPVEESHVRDIEEIMNYRCAMRQA